MAWIRAVRRELRPVGIRYGGAWLGFRLGLGLWAFGADGRMAVFGSATVAENDPATPLPPSTSTSTPLLAPAPAPASVSSKALTAREAGDVGDVDDTISLWDRSASLRSWAGYRDNPQLSAVNPVGSMFLAGGGEVMAFRLPLDGWEATFYGLLEHLDYLEPELAPETTGVVDARVKRSWGDGWYLGTGLEYYYLKQVFDASELVGVRVIIPTEGHTLGFRPVFGREHGKLWRWEIEPELSRQWLSEPLDSFLDTGTRLQWIQKLGTGSDVGISYRFRNRAFDERPPRDAEGGALSGTLEYRQHEWESVWKETWGTAGRWRTTLRGGYLRSHDNGGGYFDYERFQVGGQVRYSSDRWEWRAEAKGRWYRYDAQRASEPDGPPRRRADLTFLFRGDWKFSRRWRCFVQYEQEMSDENMAAADYSAGGVSGGVEFEL